MRYVDFAVGLDRQGEDGWMLRVLHSLEGTASAPFAVPWTPREGEELLASLERVLHRRSSSRFGPEEQRAPDPLAVGARLFDALFTAGVRDRWFYSRGQVERSTDAGLRLRLHFDLADPHAAAVAVLPWELLYDTERRDFVARNRRTPVVRYLEVPGAVEPPAATPPLRILVAGASPRGADELDIEEELGVLAHAWGRQADLELVTLPHATLEGLRSRLIESDFHVLHFVGHGDQSPKRPGVLLFEHPDGGPRPVGAGVLAQTLRDIPSLRLVVLSSCRTAAFPRRDGVDPYTGTAVALVAAGLPAVVAMQFPITDAAAIAFGSGFYGALAAGEPVDAAVVEGRQAIYAARPDTHEWAIPVLFLRTSDGHVLGPLIEHGGTSPAVRARILDSSALIEEKSRGFVGRGFVFAALDGFLRDNPRGYFRVAGQPGIGKTSIAAELVRRGRHPHHFNQRAEGIVRPESFLANLSAQLIDAFALPHATVPPEATRDAGVLVSLLGEVAGRLPEGERCVVVVDALDEASSDGLPAGVNPLFLPSRLPAGVFVVVTHRHPGPPLRVDCEAAELLVAHDSAENRADVRAYVESHLPLPGIRHFLVDRGLTEDGFLEHMADISQGNFMYLSHVLPAVARGEYRDLADPLPRGLAGYYQQQWQRMCGRDERALVEWKLPVIEALAVAREPLPLELVLRASGLDRRRVVLALELWRPFLHVVERPADSDGPVPHYRLYHESFRDFLAGRPEVDLAAAKDRLYDSFL